MTGHFHALGNFEECVNFNKKLPTPFGQLEGQYCLASIPLNPSNQKIADAYELMTKMNENKESPALKLKIKSGICLPKSCTLEDIQKLMPFKISACKSNDRIPFEPLDYVTM